MWMLLSRKLTPHEKDIIYRDVFNSPDGKIVLEELNLLFNPEKLSTNDQYSTSKKAHQADVIRHIQRRIEDGMDGSTT